MFHYLLAAYLVSPGDTLSSISAAHGVSLAAVEQANPMPDFNRITVGERIVIPTGQNGTLSSESDNGTQNGTSQAAEPTSVDPGAGQQQYQPQHASGNSSSSSGYQPRHASSSAVPAWAACIVTRESGGNSRAVNSIPGYIGNGGGLFGDLASTWNGYDGYPQPFDAPVSVQIAFNDALSDNGANLQPWAADKCPGT